MWRVPHREHDRASKSRSPRDVSRSQSVTKASTLACVALHAASTRAHAHRRSAAHVRVSARMSSMSHHPTMRSHTSIGKPTSTKACARCSAGWSRRWRCPRLLPILSFSLSFPLSFLFRRRSLDGGAMSLSARSLSPWPPLSLSSSRGNAGVCLCLNCDLFFLPRRHCRRPSLFCPLGLGPTWCCASGPIEFHKTHFIHFFINRNLPKQPICTALRCIFFVKWRCDGSNCATARAGLVSSLEAVLRGGA